MELRLANFLYRHGRTPFVWGEHDCCLWLADWIAERRGIDCAAWARGRYHDAASCADFLLAEGGIAAVVGRCARIAGLSETGAWGPGAVGLVEAFDGHGLVTCGALFAGRRWTALTLTGIVAQLAEPIIAWEV
jgi:hypothetical protein